MVRMVCLLRRNPNLTHAEFLEHWRAIHARLMSHPDLRRHLVRYEQWPRLEPGSGRGEWDGVAVQWFRSMDDFAAMVAEPAYLDTVRPDEEVLLDRGAVQVVFTEDGTTIVSEDSRS